MRLQSITRTERPNEFGGPIHPDRINGRDKGQGADANSTGDSHRSLHEGHLLREWFVAIDHESREVHARRHGQAAVVGAVPARGVRAGRRGAVGERAHQGAARVVDVHRGRRGPWQI